jgi:hypothetical protein
VKDTVAHLNYVHFSGRFVNCKIGSRAPQWPSATREGVPLPTKTRRMHAKPRMRRRQGCQGISGLEAAVLGRVRQAQARKDSFGALIQNVACNLLSVESVHIFRE